MSRLLPKLFALLILLSTSGSASSAAADCDDLADNHMKQVQCIAGRIKVLDQELNRIYQFALAALPEHDQQDTRKEREQLRKSQRAWLKFKDENCTLIGAQDGGDNLWVTHFAALCEEKEMQERIKFLRTVANVPVKP